MKTKFLYIGGALIIGLVLGYLLFSPSGSEKKTAEHEHDTTAVETVWTCSMHPQIRQQEPGNCPICGMELIPASSEPSGGADSFQLTERAVALADIQTTTVTGGSEGKGKLTLSGKISSNEEANSVQVAYFSGRIEKLNINFTGERIRSGQLLASIYSPELVSAQQELLTAVTLKNTQPELYQAVRKKLKFWKLSEKQIDQIEENGQVRENFPVYATVSGVVIEKMVAEGDYVKQGQALFKVADLRTVWAVFDAYENQISSLKIGQPVKIRSVALPGKEYDGSISFIDPVLNPTTRTVNARVTLRNPGEIFKPGMFVTGVVSDIDLDQAQGLQIPNTAVLWTGKRSIVYVKTDPQQPVFEMREVELGPRIGSQILVISGLEAGEEIVSQGTFTVDAAAQLQGKKSMMNKSGGRTTTGHEGHTGMNGTTTHSDTRVETNEAFDQQFRVLLTTYTSLKDALVEGKSEKAVQLANSWLQNLKRMDQEQRSGATANAWRQWHSNANTLSEDLAAAKDLDELRKIFKPFSQTVINGVKQFGTDLKLYHMFCPMADGNKGGYWLSLEPEVLNPYFGSAMLTCGEIVETIAP